MNASSEPSMPSNDLRARVLADAAIVPAPTRSQARFRVAAVTTIGALATTSIFYAMGGFARGGRPRELVGFVVGFALLSALVLTRLAAGRGGSMLGRPRSVIIAACIVAAPALALAALVAAHLWPEPAGAEVDAKTHFACGLLTILQGALPLIVLLAPRAGSDPIHPAITGAALGMTAGAWTAMMAYLRCPHAAAMHCILAHVVPTLVLAVLGALLGRVLLRIR